MLDLDEPQFKVAARSIPLYQRAHQYNQRTSMAVDLASALYPQLDAIRPGPTLESATSEPFVGAYPWIAVLIPPELLGISQVAQFLADALLPLNLTFHTMGLRPHCVIGTQRDSVSTNRAYNTPTSSLPSVIFNAIPSELSLRPAVQNWVQHIVLKLTNGQTVNGQPVTNQWDISATYSAENHPTVALLYFLALVAYYCRSPLDLTLSSTLLEQFNTYTVERPVADNPAKKLARQLYARIPVFWGVHSAAGLAAECCLRLQWYAEVAAHTTDLWSLSRTHIMSRYPRYWPNTAAFIHVTTAQSASPIISPASTAAMDTTATEENTPEYKYTDTGKDERDLAATLHMILSRRNFPSHQIEFAGDSILMQCIHALEFSEWLALYSATLYEVDPAAHAPFQILF